jgi:D-aspartate ligase
LEDALSTEGAVVAGLDLNGLGVLRSLGAVGVPVAAVDSNLSQESASTRFGAKLRVRALSGVDFITDLLNLRNRFKTNPVLILTQEASVATVSAARDRLRPAYHFTMPSNTLMEELMDKRRFQGLAECLGYPMPSALALSGAASMDEVKRLRFPCVMKPAAKSREYGAKFAKAYKVATPDDVERLWAAMRPVTSDVIVQEWIEGTDADVYFCLQHRAANGGGSVSFVGRKTCQWPSLVGGTATCIPAPDANATLTAMTDEFFSAIGFVGLCSMEYKRDRRDGKFYMVEPTVGRTDYQEEIATLNGVNIPFALYCSELGMPTPTKSHMRQPRGWRDPFGYARARQAGAPDPARMISPGIKICDAYWRLNDPMPAVAVKVGAVWGRMSKLIRSVPRAGA